MAMKFKPYCGPFIGNLFIINKIECDPFLYMTDLFIKK